VLEALHNIRETNIHQIIQIADDLYRRYLHIDFALEVAKAKKAIVKQRKKDKLRE
jgi:hypothetical protein